MPQLNKRISVLGTGHFGSNLAKVLQNCGYEVFLGSRNPAQRSTAIDGLKIMDIKKCVENGEIVFLALHAEDIMHSLRPYRKELENKILVDVSNGNNKGLVSTAEQLAGEFLNCTVVKAFNNISAHDLDIDISHGDRTIPIASESMEANAIIADVARNLGFSTMCYKSLKHARIIEAQQLSYFGSWSRPCMLSVFIFIMWLIYSTLRHHITKGKPFSMWPMNTMNKILGATALTILPLCYLPGTVVIMIKIFKKTPHVTLPQWLLSWIKMRQKLGLISLWLVPLHCLLSISQISPAYFSKWYKKYEYVIPANTTADLSLMTSQKMAWHGELCILLGILSLGLMAVVGLTSISTIGKRLNRLQWKVVHTYIGHICLTLSVGHVLTKQAAAWGVSPVKDLMQGISVVSLWLPSVTLLLRILVTALHTLQTCCCSTNAEAENCYSDEREMEKLTV